MSRRNVASVSYNADDPAEVGSHELREKLKKTWKLPVLRPSEDREDAAQNILTRLLEEANKRDVNLMALVEEQPDIIAKKTEAERSRVRRRRSKLAQQMSDEMAELLPAEMALSQAECAELIQQLTEAANLNPRERQFVQLCYTLGKKDYSLFAELMAAGKDELYRIANEAKNKLERVLPDVAELLLEPYEHPVQPSRDDRGTWKQSTARVV